MKNEWLTKKKKKINEGYYLYELEADSTIPSEYIMLMHFLGDINLKLEAKIQKYLVQKQNKDGAGHSFLKVIQILVHP